MVYHATNLLLHLGSTAAVFFILRLLLPVPLPAAAAVGALLFAVHPLQAEPVAWVTGRKDVLAGCLGLISVVLYFSGDREPRPERRGAWFTSAALVFALSLLAKATLVTLPLAILALQVLVRKKPWSTSVLGYAYIEKKEHPAAEAALRRSIEIEPGGEAYANLAETLQAQGRRGEARLAQRRAAGLGKPLTSAD